MKLMLYTWDVRRNTDTNNPTKKEEKRDVNKEDTREG